MASEQQKIESKQICKEFLTLNKKLGLYDGSTNTFFNNVERKKLMKRSSGGSGFGSKSILLSIKEAKLQIEEKNNI